MNSNPPRPTPRSDATRARILEAARALFNDHGTAAVSTNRIAAELGISPGNLYYHFAGKREIIRGLLAEMIRDHAQDWAEGGEAIAANPLGALRAGMVRGGALAWRYRFFGRELVALLRADPELADAYRDAYRQRMQEWTALAGLLVERELLRPRSPLPDLLAAVWLVAENWITLLEITGDADDPAEVARLLDLVFAVLEPHLTPAARELWTNGHGDDE
ncbi:TetR/AcrR family transcriptional regulator [Microbacterium album]|uniref:TetR family transcriptional regulator n=1 Tax=Microbacterium album TaxID=2053191 RepID=A0A917IID3_9MICO|nr:TetR/AcrR family transcriptional regulator [Microbacterium album]GGH50968.1 TetR family transcriptional regulator [Microbacterium album]